MQSYLFAAGILTLVVGAVHSVLGEILIFQHLRTNGLVPTLAIPPLKERNVRILWASWHVLTVLGCAFGIALLLLSFPTNKQSIQTIIENTIIFSFIVSSFLVFFGAKGKHPGWVVLLGVALLTWLN